MRASVPNKPRPLRDAVKRWADGRRELIIMGVALPMSKLAAAVERAKAAVAKPNAPDDHDARVARVMQDVRRYAEARAKGEEWARKPLRTDLAFTD